MPVGIPCHTLHVDAFIRYPWLITFNGLILASTSWVLSVLKHHRGIFNSLAPGKFEWNFRYVIFKGILVIDDWGISCEIALIWMSQDLTDDKSTLVQVMAWCRQATSHYLGQCWPRSMSPYGVTRSQWVNTTCSLKPQLEFWIKSMCLFLRF